MDILYKDVVSNFKENLISKHLTHKNQHHNLSSVRKHIVQDIIYHILQVKSCLSWYSKVGYSPR